MWIRIYRFDGDLSPFKPIYQDLIHSGASAKNVFPR